MSAQPHVVIVGAGFGGIRVLRGLRDAPVRVTLVDANNFHTFQPLLYQVATAGLDAGDVSVPVRSLVRRQRNARFLMGSVTGVDLEARRVTVDGELTLDYDYLVVAAGAVSTSFGVDGVDEHAFHLKTMDDALALRTHLMVVLEAASRAATQGRGPDVAELGVVVVGGGPTGVETAGGLRELVDRVLDRDFGEFDLRRLPITLVEAAPRLLGPFDERLAAHAADVLRRRGVEVITGFGVRRVDAQAVVLADGRVLPASTVVWAAGVAANPLATMLGVPLGRGGRVVVEADLSLPGHPEVFAVGDLAAATGADGAVLPQVAQPAIQGGRHVAAEIGRRLAGSPGQPFRYVDKGSMATIGRNQAIAELPGGLRFHGRLGWVMWLGLHLLFLVGFRNRVTTFVNWAWNYVTYDRSARAILPGHRRG